MRPTGFSSAHAAQTHETTVSIAEAIARARTERPSLRDGEEPGRLIGEMPAVVVGGTADAIHTIRSAVEAAVFRTDVGSRHS